MSLLDVFFLLGTSFNLNFSVFRSSNRYTHSIANDMNTNPEFPQASSNSNNKPNPVLNNQLYTLRNVVAQLRNAFNGHDVEWTDVGEYRQES